MDFPEQFPETAVELVEVLVRMYNPARLVPVVLTGNQLDAVREAAQITLVQDIAFWCVQSKGDADADARL